MNKDNIKPFRQRNNPGQKIPDRRSEAGGFEISRALKDVIEVLGESGLLLEIDINTKLIQIASYIKNLDSEIAGRQETAREWELRNRPTRRLYDYAYNSTEKDWSADPVWYWALVREISARNSKQKAP